MPHHVALSAAQIEQFVLDGFVRVDEAFPSNLADACRRILWLATGCTEDAPSAGGQSWEIILPGPGRDAHTGSPDGE